MNNKIALKICVPSREQRFLNWGDIYYAQSLALELNLLGYQTDLFYLNEWYQDQDYDIVIHLKGLYRYQTNPRQFNIIWILNHPELHTTEELNSYNLVLSTSHIYAEQLQKILAVPVHFLPQAGDSKVFQSKPDIAKEFQLLFVGNNHYAQEGRCRKIVQDILEIGYEDKLTIIGAAWKGFINPARIKAEFIHWKYLPMVYQKATIVLNDHQHTMREYGFINNRTFDLACMEAFQICDNVPGLNELQIPVYDTPQELKILIDQYLYNTDLRKKKAKEIKENTASYSFIARAKQIREFIW